MLHSDIRETGDTAMNLPFLDPHFHAYRRDTPMVNNSWGSLDREATVEQAMEVFDRFGIAFAVLATSAEYGLNNDYFADALARYPNLRATGNLPLDVTAADIARLSGQGFCGTRFLWRHLEVSPDPFDDDHQRMMRACADAGWHVHFTDRADRIDRTIRAIEAAGAAVIVDHMGMVDSADGANDPGFRAVLDAVGRGNTWVKLSGAFRFKVPGCADAQAAAVVAAGGRERVMWCSDWPFVKYRDTMTYAEAIGYLDRWVPDAEMKKRIGGDTALAFFFPEKVAPAAA